MSRQPREGAANEVVEATAARGAERGATCEGRGASGDHPGQATRGSVDDVRTAEWEELPKQQQDGFWNPSVLCNTGGQRHEWLQSLSNQKWDQGEMFSCLCIQETWRRSTSSWRRSGLDQADGFTPVIGDPTAYRYGPEASSATILRHGQPSLL